MYMVTGTQVTAANKIRRENAIHKVTLPVVISVTDTYIMTVKRHKDETMRFHYSDTNSTHYTI
jgi:hypothetical protein